MKLRHRDLTAFVTEMVFVGQTQTARLNYEISTKLEPKPRITPQKTSRPLMGQDQITRSKTLQAI